MLLAASLFLCATPWLPRLPVKDTSLELAPEESVSPVCVSGYGSVPLPRSPEATSIDGWLLA